MVGLKSTILLLLFHLSRFGRWVLILFLSCLSQVNQMFVTIPFYFSHWHLSLFYLNILMFALGLIMCILNLSRSSQSTFYHFIPPSSYTFHFSLLIPDTNVITFCYHKCSNFITLYFCLYSPILWVVFVSPFTSININSILYFFLLYSATYPLEKSPNNIDFSLIYLLVFFIASCPKDSNCFICPEFWSLLLSKMGPLCFVWTLSYNSIVRKLLAGRKPG